jgi:hypothetical protein
MTVRVECRRTAAEPVSKLARDATATKMKKSLVGADIGGNATVEK